MNRPVIVIDGAQFASLDEFFRHFQARVLDGANWGNNLDAFNDVLRGGFGAPEEGFVLVWQNHGVSKERLGYAETQRVLRQRLHTCHPANILAVNRELDRAEHGEGETVFDWLVAIIRDHGPTGSESEDNIELILD